MTETQNFRKLSFQFLDPLFLALSLNLLVGMAAWLTAFNSDKTQFVQLKGWEKAAEIPSALLSTYLVIEGWLSGFSDLFAFAMQMILMLALGHAVATSPLILRLLQRLAKWIAQRSHPAFWIACITAFFAWLHWGVGLIAGGVLARTVAMQDENDRIKLIRYTAAAYGGFIVWHGGWSGSAPLLVATKGHFLEKIIGIVPIQTTLLSPLNFVLLIGVTLIMALTAAYLRISPSTETVAKDIAAESTISDYKAGIAFWAGITVLFMLFLAVYMGFQKIDLNFIIILLFALALLLNGELERFAGAVKEGMDGTVGIAVQFPLYGAIMGMMKMTGLAVLISQGLVQGVPVTFFPVATFLSAGFLNLIIPSGGGQWAVQGPILMQAAQEIGASFSVTITAFAWGDAWTNLIQPFWALPLLAMTHTKAHEILPATAKICFTTGLTISVILLGSGFFH